MSEETSPRLNPRELLIDISGRKYLPVAARLALFRERYRPEDGYGLRHELLLGEMVPPGHVMVRAWATHPDGTILGESIKTAPTGGKFPAWEKAESGAYGRLMGLLGIGTLFAVEWDDGEDGDVCDTPVESKKGPPTSRPGTKHEAQREPTPEAKPAPSPGGTVCTTCGGDVSKGRQDFCRTKKQPVTCGPTNPECPSHPKNAAKPAPTAAPTDTPLPNEAEDAPPPPDEETV
jgi:hypothetical protein